jgi:phenylacetate-CoA ligase
MASQFPSRQIIASHQLRQLRRLLADLLPRNRFYQKKLDGLPQDIPSLADFSRAFPLTTKAELVEDQRNFPPFGTNLSFPTKDYVRFHQTSGTTSAPLRWLDTRESWQWMVENWMRIYQAGGISSGERIYFAFSFGPFIGFWLAFEAAAQMGCLCIPGGGASTLGRLRAILDNRATVLCCTPSYALRMGEVAAEHGIDLRLSSLRAIIVAGEPGGSIPATRRRIEQFWPRARVLDHHGMTETGPVSLQCPAHPRILHVMEWAFFPEVIASNGQPAAPGQTGELVLTPLGRTGSPLLRYRTGDLVRPAPSGLLPCSCGRWDLALTGGILGRADDMIIVRGVNIYPSAVEEIVAGFEDVAEYQVEVNLSGTLTEMTIQIEPRAQCANPAELAKRLQSQLQSAFHLRVPVRIARPGALPRFEMKAKRWVASTAA